jgi:hypothetical protein
MLPQTIIWYAMLMRGRIKAERTRTANWILRARQVLVSTMTERRAPARPEQAISSESGRGGARRSNFVAAGIFACRIRRHLAARPQNQTCELHRFHIKTPGWKPGDTAGKISPLRFFARPGGLPGYTGAMRTGRTNSHLAA